MFVKTTLENLDIDYLHVDLGEVTLKKKETVQQRQGLRIALLDSGLELMDDNRLILVEKIENCIVEMIQCEEENRKINFSEYLSVRLNHNYTYLANLFSHVTGTTIESSIISHKVELAKELLLYGELNLSEIAWKLHYSSLAHLSNQFKQVTGITPTSFKKVKQYSERIEIERI